jgi:hypothetical protein
MLGIETISSGRMGNRLFHYHFFHQLIRVTNIAYFQPQFPENKYFYNMAKKLKPVFPLRQSLYFTSQEILRYHPKQFISFVIKESINNKNTIIQPPILGEVFFDYLFCSPSEIIRIKDEYMHSFSFNTTDKIIIGLHFRGTDFQSWNEKAALKFPYYQKAVLYCLNYFKPKQIVFALYTDDDNYPAFVKTIDYFKDKKIEFYLSDKNIEPIYDFYQMTQCDVLISSPSTFAIFAGCLGKKKKIIHSKKWLEYSVQRNDIFWLKLLQTKNSYYSLWKSF